MSANQRQPPNDPHEASRHYIIEMGKAVCENRDLKNQLKSWKTMYKTLNKSYEAQSILLTNYTAENEQLRRDKATLQVDAKHAEAKCKSLEIKRTDAVCNNRDLTARISALETANADLKARLELQKQDDSYVKADPDGSARYTRELKDTISALDTANADLKAQIDDQKSIPNALKKSRGI